MRKLLRLLGKGLRCSFCGRSEHEVQKLVAGGRALICETCIALCVEAIDNGPGFAQGQGGEKVVPALHERLGGWFGRLRRARLHLVEVGR
jgi:ClpX C4-type zinc finger